MNWITERLKEKSTWLGAVTILTSFGVTLSPELSAAIISAGVAIAGLIFAITKEKK